MLPSAPHWVAVKHIIRYISATRLLGFTYKGPWEIWRLGFSDSDWAWCPATIKITSGYVRLLAGAVVTCKAKRQSLIAASSGEDEYVSGLTAFQEALPLGYIFISITHLSSPPAIPPRIDNQGAIELSKQESTPQGKKRTDITYHVLWDLFHNQSLSLSYCPTAEMKAEPLTKTTWSLQYWKHITSYSVYWKWPDVQSILTSQAMKYIHACIVSTTTFYLPKNRSTPFHQSNTVGMLPNKHFHTSFCPQVH